MVVLSELTVRAINIAVLVLCSLELIILMIGYPSFRLSNRASGIFYAMMLVSTFTIVFYTFSFIFESGSANFIGIIPHAISYVGLYAVFVLFIAYVRENVNNVKRSGVPEWVIYLAALVGIIGSLFWIISLFNNSISELSSHHLRYGRIFAIGHLGGFILIAISFVILFKHHKALGVRETTVLTSMPVLMLLATFLEPVSQGIELRFPCVVLEFLIVYTQHHLELEIEHEVRETKEMKQRMSLATGRMKPHYLYNVLTTIYYLIEGAPEKAQNAVGMFSEYIRSTLESMNSDELVEFSWELTEIRNYLALEKLRFGDRLTVEYDIEYDEFMIPPLTVQTLVENAVDHGISASESGGTVSVATRKLADGSAEIRVIDDGVGFDVSELKSNSFGGDGVASVRGRLQREMGGDITITSSPGSGTTAIITIKPQDNERYR